MRGRQRGRGRSRPGGARRAHQPIAVQQLQRPRAHRAREPPRSCAGRADCVRRVAVTRRRGRARPRRRPEGQEAARPAARAVERHGGQGRGAQVRARVRGVGPHRAARPRGDRRRGGRTHCSSPRSVRICDHWPVRPTSSPQRPERAKRSPPRWCAATSAAARTSAGSTSPTRRSTDASTSRSSRPGGPRPPGSRRCSSPVRSRAACARSPSWPTPRVGCPRPSWPGTSGRRHSRSASCDGSFARWDTVVPRHSARCRRPCRHGRQDRRGRRVVRRRTHGAAGGGRTQDVKNAPG